MVKLNNNNEIIPEGIILMKFLIYIDPALDSIQSLLDDETISVAEEHIGRKTISKVLNNLEM